MNAGLKSFLLVSLQFFFILLLVLGSDIHGFSILAFSFLAASFVLVIWAFLSMRKSRLRIIPMPSEDAVLITDGPYQYIRHPMYSSILIGSIGLLINYFSWLRLGILIALFIVLLIKLKWEEKMLSVKFGDYKHYMQHSSMLIPFFF
jgi:protein-S-isoprenylcysteine O-methyltransferase Ste14